MAKSQFRTPPGSHVHLISHRGRYHIEAKRDGRRGDFVVTVNKKIVDRQSKARGATHSFDFWVSNCEGYKVAYFVQPKKGT